MMIPIVESTLATLAKEDTEPDKVAANNKESDQGMPAHTAESCDVEGLQPKGNSSGVKLRPMMSLCLAYAANIGGTGSLIGTPPNLLLADALEKYDGQPINFLSWMVLALPQVRH